MWVIQEAVVYYISSGDAQEKKGQNNPSFQASIIIAGVMIQAMMWMNGAVSVKFAGPAKTCEWLRATHSADGTYVLEAGTMPKCSQTTQPLKSRLLAVLRTCQKP